MCRVRFPQGVRSVRRGQMIDVGDVEAARLDALGFLTPATSKQQDSGGDVESMKVADLRALATEKGIDTDGLRKADLVDALKDAA